MLYNKLRRILAVICALALSLPISVRAEEGDPLSPSYLGHTLVALTYDDFLAADPEDRYYDAALTLLDASTSSPDLFYSMIEAQDYGCAFFVLPTNDPSDAELRFLYFLNDCVWEVASYTDEYLLEINLIEELGHAVTEADIRAVVQRYDGAAVELDASYCWQWVVTLIVNMTNSSASETTGAAAGAGNGPAFREPIVVAEGSGWPVRIELSADLVITDEMSDFQFCINGTDFIPARANPNVNLVTGTFYASRNGLYIVFLIYKLDGQEISERLDVEIDSIDESMIPEQTENVSEPHQHEHELVMLAEHPHASFACECGDTLSPGELDLPAMVTPFQSLDCCECVGHSWEIGVHDGVLLRSCVRCGETVWLETPKSQAWQDYIDLIDRTQDTANCYRDTYGIDETGTSLWRVIASQSTNLLTDRGFVWGNNYLDALESPTGAVVDYAVDLILPSNEFEKRQVELWRELIVEMLENPDTNPYAGLGNGLATGLSGVQAAYSAADNVWEIAKNLDKSSGQYQEKIASASKTLARLRADFDNLMNTTSSLSPDYAAQLQEALDIAGGYEEVADQLDELQEGLDSQQSLSAAFKSIPWILTYLSAVSKGTEAMNSVAELQDAYWRMSLDFEANRRALEAIISDANAMDQPLLAEAAQEMLEEIRTEHALRTADTFSFLARVCDATMDTAAEAGAFFGTSALVIGEAVANYGIDKLLEKLGGSYMGVVGLSASGIKLLSNHNEVYQLSSELLALSSMSSGMNLTATLEGGTSSDYTFELWGYVQERGCQTAAQLISTLDKNLFGVRYEDLGLPEEAGQEILGMLSTDEERYSDFAFWRGGDFLSWSPPIN